MGVRGADGDGPGCSGSGIWSRSYISKYLDGARYVRCGRLNPIAWNHGAVAAASRLRHPGVVPVECAFLDRGNVVVQSPFYFGGNMREWCRGKDADQCRPYKGSQFLFHIDLLGAL